MIEARGLTKRAEVVFEQWAARSRHDWTLDCTVLEAQGVHFEPTRPVHADPATGGDPAGLPRTGGAGSPAAVACEARWAQRAFQRHHSS